MKHYLLLILGVFAMHQSFGQNYNQNFNNVNNLTNNDWVMQNNSQPIGVTSWSQGVNVANGGPFNALNGANTSYISANHNNVTGSGTISNWLITPQHTFVNGDVISFFTRTAGTTFPDRLELRFSTAGASTNVGTTATSVGDFTTVLLTVNPDLTTTDYPTTWTHYTATISGLSGPTLGRAAFRYFVTNGGPDGTNSDFIGIDKFKYKAFTCPTITIGPEAALPVASGGMPYLQMLSQTGGAGEAVFTVTDGALPGGITLSEDGELGGQATETGTFTFTVTVVDANGCDATMDFTLTVTPCTLNLPISLPNIISGCAVTWDDVEVPEIDDTCGNTITPATDTGVFPITAQGTTTITWTYTNTIGGTTTLTQDVIIHDTTAPELILQDTAVQLTTGATVTITAAQFDNGSTDACTSIESWTVVPHTFGCNGLGTQTVTITATDANGNIATGTAHVTITDPDNFCETAGSAAFNKTAFRLYPNPTSGIITIDVPQGETVQGISIYSVLGQELFKSAYNDAAVQYNLSLARFEAGAYRIILQTSAGKVTRQVVKVR